EIAVPHGREPVVHGAIVHHVANLPPAHVCLAYGIPVTTPSRTIVDLAGLDDITRHELAATLDHGIKRGRVTCDQVRAVLAQLPRCKGHAKIVALLAQRHDGRARVESPMEAEVQELLLWEDFVFSPQYEVIVDGRFIGR